MNNNGRPAIFLGEATQSAHTHFYDVIFSKCDLNPEEQKRARRYLEDPFWRPLCELEVNGATNFEGAMLLLAAGLIDYSSFQVRYGPAVGSGVQCVDFTDEGLQQFEYYAGEQVDSDLKEKLINSLMSYALIDYGSGVVARRCAMEAALENDDWTFLTRLRTIPIGMPQFQQGGVEVDLSEEARAEYLEYVSGWEGPRYGASIIELNPNC